MEKRELTCIGCPLGCSLTVTMETGAVTAVEGYTCKRGKEYGEKECTHPMRMVTSSVSVAKGKIPMVSVKTKEDIPKEMIAACMKAIHCLKVTAPVKIGEVLLENIADTGVALIATKTVVAKQD